MKGTRKMRKSVSEFGRFQISLATFSGGGTTVGLARSVIAETASVGSMGSRQISVRRIVPLEDGGKAGTAGCAGCPRLGHHHRPIILTRRATRGIPDGGLTFQSEQPRISVPARHANVAEFVDPHASQ